MCDLVLVVVEDVVLTLSVGSDKHTDTILQILSTLDPLPSYNVSG